MKQTLAFIPAPLLAWYRANKRDLPWRGNPTPYQVWVSEIMLQQTRVEAVKEYYTRFINALPTVQDLAECEEEKLLKLWEGLGYYSRVRNMQKAAKTLTAYYDGIFPKRLDELVSLPGIGEYTAGAIASIAYKQPCAAVDGNVLRVVSRLLADNTPISNLAYRRRIAQALTAVYPSEGETCAEFTQSIFELGALICKPQNPSCLHCPLSRLCQAHKQGTQNAYPVKEEKRAKREENVYVFLMQTPHGFCLRRRESGVLKGMNEFPSVVSQGESVTHALQSLDVTQYQEIARRPFTHIFTHIRWNIICVWIQTETAPFDTYTLEEIKESISLPTAFRQCLKMIEDV